MSRLHVHRRFIQSLKLCLNLYSFRWLNPSQSLVINLSPSGLKMPNIELGIGQIIFMKVALKIWKLDVQISKLSLFHSFIVHWFCRYYLCIIASLYTTINYQACHWRKHHICACCMPKQCFIAMACNSKLYIILF